MKEFLTLFLIIYTTIALSQNSQYKRNNFLNSSIETDAENIPRHHSTFYFPVEFYPKYVSSNKYIDSTSVLIGTMWYTSSPKSKKNDTTYLYSTKIPNTVDSQYIASLSTPLFALKEPLLYNKPTNKEIYRFTLLRSFDNPVSIRIEKFENSIWIYSKIGQGASGFKSKKIKQSKKAKISTEDWNAFSQLMDELDFWNLSQSRSAPMTDGSEWILEGSTPEWYSVHSVRSPNKGSEFYRTCIYLLELSKIHIREDRIY